MSGRQVAEPIINEAFKRIPNLDLPNPSLEIRSVNLVRAAERPHNPTSINFEMNMKFIESNWLVGDVPVTVDGETARHIMFASPYQLQLMSKAERWAADATFGVVADPFPQLFSVHCMVRCDDQECQVPLIHVLMSRRRIEDYIGVFQRILEIFPCPPSVQQVILDFESAVWTALRFVLPNVSLHRCGFHFSQAVYRNIQSCGLATDYNNDPSINSACRSLLALKYIPAAKIKKSFDKLTALPEHGVIDPRLKKFYEYFDRQWIKNTAFPPSTWSI